MNIAMIHINEDSGSCKCTPHSCISTADITLDERHLIHLIHPSTPRQNQVCVAQPQDIFVGFAAQIR